MTQWLTFKGLTDYNAAEILMNEYVDKVINYETENTILLLEHNEVYTFGVSTQEGEVLNNNTDIPIVSTNRGGRVTYHGPGQRIIYPIIDLRKDQDIKKFVRNLQNWIVATLQQLGVETELIENSPGVWVYNNFSGQYSKIASLGIRLKKWITYHGIAVNICPNLLRFNDIVSCGIKNLSVTSLKILNKSCTFDEFDIALKGEYEKFFL